jgi:1,4-alpha-glucan branching enzyme
MLFMGTETHQDGHWHTEEEASMDWSLIARGGEKWAKEGMACVKAANEMRTQHWALTRGTARVIQADHENGIIVVERHYEGVEEDGKTKMNQRLIVVVNDGDGQWDAEGTYGINVGPPWGEDGGAFEEIFNSQDEDFGGWPGSGNKERGVINQEGESLQLAIPKLGVVVLKQVTGKSKARDPDLVLAELSAGAAASISALGR